MKKLTYILLSVVLLATTFSCQDHLNTNPTTTADETTVFASASNAMAAMNGIYRLLYTYGWGGASNWDHENGGIMAYIAAQDLMGEDRLMNDMGSGWFYMDYSYGIFGDYSSVLGRQYQVWNFFYTLISNANYIIAHESDEALQDDPDLANYLFGQAYAMRAYSYLWLVQSYQQNDPSLPGVPIYTEPTTPESEGKGRGTVQDVYTRINEDINTAISYFENSATEQQHPSHIDKYVAYGIKARAMMVQHNYKEAVTAAKEALKKPGISMDFTETVNDISATNVMWGLEILTDQAIGNAGIYAHMDADCGGTYCVAQHLISSWLYDQIPATDSRRAWWTDPAEVDKNSKLPSYQKPYIQHKLVYKNAASGTGDYILMRAEEMALIVAEAACHDKDYTTAREYVKMVTSQRDSDYEANLAKYPDSNVITTETSTQINSLIDYILFQRRVELWGEFPRMQDLKRLGLPMHRNYSYQPNNHTTDGIPYDYEAGYDGFIYAIPLEEFNGNTALNPETDQNPLDY